MKYDLSKMSDRLRYIIAMNGMTQAEFAEKTGVSKTSVNQAISNKRGLSKEGIDAILDAFKGSIDANWLIRGEGKTPFLDREEIAFEDDLDASEDFSVSKDERIRQLEDEVAFLRRVVENLSQKPHKNPEE